MKIEDKRLDRDCVFGELLAGQVFTDLAEKIYMKVFAFGSDATPVYNAVLLKSGEMVGFSDNEEVRRIDAKVVIK